MGLGCQNIYRRVIVRITQLMWLAAILTIGSGCNRQENQLPVTTAGGEVGFPDQEMFQPVIRLTIDDKPRLTLVAKHLSRFEAQSLLLLDGGIKADVYDLDGKHKALLTAREGEVIEGVNSLLARGNVVVTSDSGIVLRGEEIRFDPAFGRIVSDGFVTITSPTDSLAGYGFNAAPDLTDWEIKNTSGATWRDLERDTTRSE